MPHYATLQVYKQEAIPVEDFYEQRGILINFEITGGIPVTLPRLLELLQPLVPRKSKDLMHA